MIYHTEYTECTEYYFLICVNLCAKLSLAVFSLTQIQQIEQIIYHTEYTEFFL